jgi:hypothetical protein
MTRLVSLSGKVSRLSPSGMELAQRYFTGEASPDRRLSFLVDDRPASYEGHPIVGEGDLVTIAGPESGGVVRALAIRNRSTGVDYGGGSPLLYLLCVIAVAVGLLTLTLSGLGLLFLAVAAYLGGLLRRSSRALSMVRTDLPARGISRS